MVKVPLCPTCGHPIVSDEIGIVLTPLQRRIFNIVKRAGIAGISRDDLMEMLYANAADGGPSNRNIIAVTCHQMNRRLAQFSIAIKGSRGSGSNTFALCRLRSGRWIRAVINKEENHAPHR